ncbi:MAG: peptidase inhibitor family I36 protein [Acidobacteriota bacterium]
MDGGRQAKLSWKKVAFLLGAAVGLGFALPAHTPTSNQLYVYEHINYGGAYIRWDGIRDISDLRSYNTGALGTPNWNDRISSFKVGSDLKVIFYEHINYKGASWTVTGPASIPSLVPNGWNDRASSLRTVPK